MEFIVKKLTVEAVNFIVDGHRVGGADVEKNGDDIWVENFTITPEYRGKGYAQQAIKMLIDSFGINTLTCAVDKKVAIHIYEKFGFEIVDEVMHDYDGRSYLMKRGEK